MASASVSPRRPAPARVLPLALALLVSLALVPRAIAATTAAATAPAPATALSLERAVGIAAGGSAPVQIAGLRTREAAGRRAQSRAALLPGISGSASTVNRTFSIAALGLSFPSLPGAPPTPDLAGPFDVIDARVRATQTLFDFASWVRVREAGTGVRLSEAERGQSVEGAAQSAALAYLRAAREQAVLDARRADLDLATQLLALAEEQRRAGVSPGIDVTRARTQVAAARGQMVVAENQLERARMDLARALGVDPATRFALSDTLAAEWGASPAPEDSQAALALALERRPELLAERLRLSRARSEHAAISAERLPRLEASADVGLSGRDWPGSATTRQVGIAASVPLLDGLRREGRLTEQRALIDEAQVRERDLEQQIAAEVEGALLDLASGRELEVVSAERLGLAAEELAQARERFTSGVASNIEVINAQSSLVRARDAEIDARFAIGAARVSLARATGVCRSLR